jgi:hypothetical protein
MHELLYSETLAPDLKALLETWALETWRKRVVDNYCPLDIQQRGRYDRVKSIVWLKLPGAGKCTQN